MKLKFSSDQVLLLNAEIKTKQLILEPLVSQHADLFFKPLQSEKIYKWISSDPPESLLELLKYYKKLESRLNTQGNEARLNWAIRRISDGVYIGKFDADVNTANVATNIGYLFFPAYWGSGYATESVSAIVKHLAMLGVLKMFATVTLGNEASYRVLEKSGFARNRIIPDNDIIRSAKFDDIEYVWTND